VVNLAILSKTSSLIQKFLETQSQRRKDVPLRESWIVHIFHRKGKEAIQFFHIQANYSQKLSIISKQSKLIPKELRYQEKIHAII
jgi:hypothetical protein